MVLIAFFEIKIVTKFFKLFFQSLKSLFLARYLNLS
jgi:hypothetical protein